jgi:lysophospholipase L1-like esterase
MSLSRRKKISLALLALPFLTLLALEGLLRLAPPPPFSANWVYDPVLGHRGPRGQLVALSSWLLAPYHSFGYRGENPTPRGARSDIFSVVVLGDSITEATQLPWRRSFVPRLELLLSEELGRDTEVTAFAASDYGTANELLAYSQEAKQLEPNLVVLQFLGLNDFVNNGLGFAGRNKALSDFSRPYLVPKRLEGQVESFPLLGENFTYLRPAWKRWRERSRLLSYLERFWLKSAWEKKRESELENPRACSTELEVFLDEADERWQDAFEVTGRLARRLRAEVEAPAGGNRAGRLLALYVPSYFEVHEPTWERVIQPTLAQCFTRPFKKENPEKRFLELFREAGVQAYSLRKDFSASPQSLYLPDGHLSSEGHRLLAHALARIAAQRKNLYLDNAQRKR